MMFEFVVTFNHVVIFKSHDSLSTAEWLRNGEVNYPVSLLSLESYQSTKMPLNIGTSTNTIT